MTNFILRRLIHAGIVMIAMSFFIYLLIGLMPGDPIDLLANANPEITAADVARLKALYGLDRPLLERYGNWLGATIQGDFGYSRLYAKPVLEVLATPILNTVILMASSLILACLLALPLALVAARFRRTWLDHGVNCLAFAGMSVPSFWLCLLMILLFAVELRWLPAGGVYSVGDGSFIDRLEHAVLPVATLTVLTLGTIVRFGRGALIEGLGEAYVRTARAKGLGRMAAINRHVLPNALLPVVTVLALNFGTLLSGALVIETIFAYGGMGKLIYDAVLGNDFNLALIGLLAATILTLLSSLFADILYAWLDPRITYGDG
ncbi:MAG: ABC transporter permease [Geminicoccaceae bacterium]